LSYVLREFASAAELHHCAPAWDDLWQRSDHTSALFRAAMVTQWLEQFGPHQRSRILVVEDQGQMVAGVPLCQRRAARVLPVADVTLNYWSPNGDLLVDPQADVAAAMRVLLEGLERAPWPLLWFDCVPFEWPNWQALVTAAEQAGWTRLVRPRYCVGQVNLATGFDACETCWSKNHRRNLRRDMRRLEERGPVRLALHRHSTPAEVEPLLRRAFEIEDRGWKGREGTSVLHAPAIFQFFVRQGQQLAEWDSLCLAFLEVDEQPIAFEYGWISKNVYYSYKIGYDEDFSRFAPGHLVRSSLLKSLAAEGVRLVDFCGPMTPALAAWSTQSYPVGRLILAPPRTMNRALLETLRVLAAWRNRLHHRVGPPAIAAATAGP
jgi:CelD/BcsL family acetyltransferase involved in cellulose biosynthesis